MSIFRFRYDIDFIEVKYRDIDIICLLYTSDAADE